MHQSSVPLFSVVIPTYNRANLIERTLASVLAQTYPNYEILIVDNNSQDNTQEVINKYLFDKRIVYIKHDTNYERAKSRNTGMTNARGDFVTFLDSDDIMYPNNLLEAKSFIDQNSDIKLFHNLYELIDINGNIVYKYSFPNLKNMFKNIAVGNFFSCIGVFLCKDIYKKLKFNESPQITGSEDWDYWLRVIPFVERIGRIKKINSGILQHSERTVNAQSPEQVIKRKRKVIDILQADEFYRKRYDPYFKLMEANIYIYAAIVSYEREPRSRTFKLLFKAIRKDWSQLFTIRFLKAIIHVIIKG